MKKYKLAVVGATGVVGQKMIQVLEEKKLPISEYVFFASQRSSGKTLKFIDDVYCIKELKEDSFDEELIKYSDFFTHFICSFHTIN